MKTLEEAFLKQLIRAFDVGDVCGVEARKAIQIHAEYMHILWRTYDDEVHLTVVMNYLEDENYIRYYDQYRKGLLQFFVDAFLCYMNMSDE